MEELYKTESQAYYMPETDEEKRRLKKMTNLQIRYKGYLFDLPGFKVIKQKGVVVFSYKIKLHSLENKEFLYYKPSQNESFDDLIKQMQQNGYRTTNIVEMLEKALSERKMLNKAKEKKRKGKRKI